MDESMIDGGWRRFAWAGVAMLVAGGDALIGIAMLLAGGLALDGLLRSVGWAVAPSLGCLALLVALPACPPLAWLIAVAAALAAVAAGRAPGGMGSPPVAEN